MDKKRIILFACFALCSLGMTMMQTSCLLDPIFWEDDNHGDPVMDGAREYYAIGNYSDEVILCYMSLGKKEYAPTVYPDTLLPECISKVDHQKRIENLSTPLLYYAHNYFSVVPRLIICYPDDRILYDKIDYNDGIDTVSVFFLSRDSIFKYGYYDIQKTYQILARYDICKREFKERKEPLLICYPPIENMRNFKMIPSYEELNNRLGKESMNK